MSMDFMVLLEAIENLAVTMKSMYDAFIGAGFSKKQAEDLCNSFVQGLGMGMTANDRQRYKFTITANCNIA
jgi:hypothetical protein